MPRRKPKLTIKQILAWADHHYKHTGQWPKQTSGAVVGTRAENWAAISHSLLSGFRSLPGGSTIAKLLYVKRGVSSQRCQQGLSVARILAWAGAHHHRTGLWPRTKAGAVAGEASENWRRIDSALRRGARGLPGGSSLSKILPANPRSSRRRVAHPLTVQHLLRWADHHRRRTGRWPTLRSGTVHNAPSEVWVRLDNALRRGFRGFAGGSSLSRLLARDRDAGGRRRPRLTLERILAWADEYHARNERWPTVGSGNLLDVPDMNWRKIDDALRSGYRRLPGGSSLSKILAEQRNARYGLYAPRLTNKQVLAWADAHHRRTGAWPTANSGAVREAPAEKWSAINAALEEGLRGLSGGASLARLLAEWRGARNPKDLPKLTVKQILSWANRHFERTGRWPTARSGRVVGASGETWSTIDAALRRGSRQLHSRSSLARLLKKHRRDLAR